MNYVCCLGLDLSEYAQCSITPIRSSTIAHNSTPTVTVSPSLSSSVTITMSPTDSSSGNRGVPRGLILTAVTIASVGVVLFVVMGVILVSFKKYRYTQKHPEQQRDNCGGAETAKQGKHCTSPVYSEPMPIYINQTEPAPYCNVYYHGGNHNSPTTYVNPYPETNDLSSNGGDEEVSINPTRAKSTMCKRNESTSTPSKKTKKTRSKRNYAEQSTTSPMVYPNAHSTMVPTSSKAPCKLTTLPESLLLGMTTNPYYESADALIHYCHISRSPVSDHCDQHTQDTEQSAATIMDDDKIYSSPVSNNSETKQDEADMTRECEVHVYSSVYSEICETRENVDQPLEITSSSVEEPHVGSDGKYFLQSIC